MGRGIPAALRGAECVGDVAGGRGEGVDASATPCRGLRRVGVTKRYPPNAGARRLRRGRRPELKQTVW